MQKKITREEAGVRLDAFLPSMCGITRARGLKWIEGGSVLLNGEAPAKAGIILREGDDIAVDPPEAKPISTVAQDIPLDIVYQDADIAVINKPRGMVVHPAAGHGDGTLVNALLAACPDISGVGDALRPGIVHRLDKDTTGLLVVAKNDAAHLALSEQLRSHEAGREYFAVVFGSPGEESGTVNAPIGRHPRDRKRMAVVQGGREAVTHWEVQERLRGSTLLRVKLETGRTHQIRVHMRSIGFPLLGDAVYGVKTDKTSVLMLHAHKLTFVHPTSGEIVTFSVSPPEDFCKVIVGRKMG